MHETIWLTLIIHACMYIISIALNIIVVSSLVRLIVLIWYIVHYKAFYFYSLDQLTSLAQLVPFGILQTVCIHMCIVDLHKYLCVPSPSTDSARCQFMVTTCSYTMVSLTSADVKFIIKNCLCFLE